MNDKEENKINEIEELMGKGFDAAYSDDFDNAIKIGKELIKKRHSSGFEILALGYQGKCKNKKAISILEKGVKKVPDVYKMWQLLGNLYSNEECFKKSYEAYKNGLKCPNAEKDSLYLNYAIALDGNGDTNEAIAQLNKAQLNRDDNLFKICYWSTKYRLLNQLDRFNETIENYKQVIKELNFNENENSELVNADEFISNLHYEFAFALWKKNQLDELDIAINMSIMANKHNDRTKWLIREMRNSISPDVFYYNVIINGEWTLNKSEDGNGLNFFTNYGVIAENEEEALKFIMQFEPKEFHNSIEIEEIKQKKKMPKEPKGVYYTSAYCFYDRDEE